MFVMASEAAITVGRGNSFKKQKVDVAWWAAKSLLCLPT